MQAAEGLARGGDRIGAPKSSVPGGLLARMLGYSSLVGEFIRAVWVSRALFSEGPTGVFATIKAAADSDWARSGP